MKVLITGGAGFLGGHLVDACVARGDEVTVAVRKTSNLSHLLTLAGKISFVYGDLTDPGIAPRIVTGQEVVFHSAALVTDVGQPAQFEAANVTATRFLLDAAKKAGVQKFIYVSSPSVVAEDRDQCRIDESYPFPENFLNDYSRTKAMAETLVLKASDDRFVTCALRPRGIWGTRDPHGFIARLLERLKAGTLKRVSGEKVVSASLCHVENAVQACLLAGDSYNVGGKAYFISDEEPVDLWRFIDRLALEFGLSPVTRRVHPRVVKLAVALCEWVWQFPWPGHYHAPPITRYTAGLMMNTSTYNIDRAKRDFGYAPSMDLERGLAQLKAWVADNGGVDALINA